MTESEWLACSKAESMQDYLETSERKIKLFAVGCCRRIWHLLDSDISRPAVELIERFADDQATHQELWSIYRQFYRSGVEAFDRSDRLPLSAESYLVYRESQRAFLISHAADFNTISDKMVVFLTIMDLQRETFKHRKSFDEESNSLWSRQFAIEEVIMSELFRDIFGNPFSPVPLDPYWLTSDVVAMARGMYETRDFSAMPIIADALQDAGCENEDILIHCRGDGPHVRGCWVVDLLLRKE